MAYDHGAFRVRNRENAIEFYTKKLGFQLVSKTDADNIGEKNAFLDYNGARLELIETTYEAYEPVRPQRPYCPHLCFETDDMDAVIQTLKENDIEIIDGPNEIPGSEQWLYFMDPDMNVLEYIYWVEKHEHKD